MEINEKLRLQMKNEIEKIDFFKVNSMLSNDFIVTNDFKEAYELAFHKDDYEGDMGSTWTDIREEMKGYYMSIIYKEKDYKLIYKLLSEVDVEEWITNCHFSEESDKVYNEICFDLDMCVQARQICEIPFFEKMYQAYIRGAWPCGIEEATPNGRLIVYVPKHE